MHLLFDTGRNYVHRQCLMFTYNVASRNIASTKKSVSKRTNYQLLSALPVFYIDHNRMAPAVSMWGGERRINPLQNKFFSHNNVFIIPVLSFPFGTGLLQNMASFVCQLPSSQATKLGKMQIWNWDGVSPVNCRIIKPQTEQSTQLPATSVHLANKKATIALKLCHLLKCCFRQRRCLYLAGLSPPHDWLNCSGLKLKPLKSRKQHRWKWLSLSALELSLLMAIFFLSLLEHF